MDSILTSVKKLLGIVEDDTSFDIDIIIYINAAFATLRQLGVGPLNGFSISDKSSTWDEFIDEDGLYELTKTYVYMKVKKIFDPSSSSQVSEAMNHMIEECEFRLKTASETPVKED